MPKGIAVDRLRDKAPFTHLLNHLPHGRLPGGNATCQPDHVRVGGSQAGLVGEAGPADEVWPAKKSFFTQVDLNEKEDKKNPTALSPLNSIGRKWDKQSATI